MRMAWLPLSCFLFCFVLFLFYTGTSPILAMVADEGTFSSCPTVHAFPIQQSLEGVEWGKYLTFLLSIFPVHCCRQNIKPEHVMFLPGNSTMANKEKLLQAMKNVAVLNTPTPLCGSTCKHLIGFQDSLSISWRQSSDLDSVNLLWCSFSFPGLYPFEFLPNDPFSDFLQIIWKYWLYWCWGWKGSSSALDSK